MNTHDIYPDATIPGWLRDIRDGKADKMTVTAAAVYGAEQRTREIARERLAAMQRSVRAHHAGDSVTYTHEADCEPREMTPEQAEAYRQYAEHRPDDPAERERLRRIFMDCA